MAADHRHFAYWLSPQFTASFLTKHLAIHSRDQAYLAYCSRLKDFILSTVYGINQERTSLQNGLYQFSMSEHFGVDFSDDKKIFHHPELYIRYMKVNGCLGIDKLIRGSTFIVYENRDSKSTPYRFGQVIEIFHIWIMRPEIKKIEAMDVVWARWYEIVPTAALTNQNRCHGYQHENCPGRLRFVEATKADAFGFLKPTEIIRSVSVVGDVMAGITTSLLAPSCARVGPSIDSDYNYYVAECQTDHDIFARLHFSPDVYRLVRDTDGTHLSPSEVGQVLPPFLQMSTEIRVENENGRIGMCNNHAPTGRMEMTEMAPNEKDTVAVDPEDFLVDDWSLDTAV